MLYEVITRPSTAGQQPEGERLQREVHYLPSTLSPAVLAANARALVGSPRRYLRVWIELVKEWWRDRRAGRAWQSSHATESYNFV